MSSVYSIKGSGRANSASLKALMTGITQGNLDAYDNSNALKSIVGNESLMPAEMKARHMNGTQSHGTQAAVALASDKDFGNRVKKLGDMMRLSGLESFSAQLEQGQLIRQKAATIELNNISNRQWAGPEALYPTVIIPYADEALLLPVDVAGVGAYNMTGNVNEMFDDLRPIASVLADSKFSPGDDLRLYPVLPEDPKDPNFGSFVPTASWAPWEVSYGTQDLLSRGAHKTNYLAIKKANNLMALCQAPGSLKFTNQDEIEQNSIALDSILFKIESKDAAAGVFVALDTRTMGGRAMRPSTGVTSDDKREVRFPVNGLDVKNLKDKAGVPTTAFSSLQAAGLKVFVAFEFTATYNRSTRSWAPTVGPMSISWVIDANGVKMIPGTGSMTAEVQALVDAQAFVGNIDGVYMYMNHNNVDRSRYGTTVVYASDVKPYNIHRRNPISIRFPMDEDDTNAEVLAMMVKQMDVMCTRNMSHDAIKAAKKHFDYLYDNNGARIVGINNDGADILPAQHFLTTTAIKASVNLIEEVSTLDTKDTRANIEAVLVNKLYDVITALRVKSNLAALKELDNRAEVYQVMAHSSLAPFLMKSGEYRTFGEDIKFEIVETNIDSEIGTFWVVPKSQTKDTQIDVFGGMGVCVAKELLVVEGTVNQANTQFRMIITQPAYAHHSLCNVAGKVVVADMDKLLGDEGLIAAVNKHLVKVSGKLETTAAALAGDGKEVPVEPGIGG